MNVFQNYYRTLSVSKLSSEDDIKKAYMILAMNHHPDLHNNDPVKAAKMADINVAYNVLKNSKSRKEYDKQLALFGSKCGACEGSGGVKKQKGFSKKKLMPCDICAGTGVI